MDTPCEGFSETGVRKAKNADFLPLLPAQYLVKGAWKIRLRLPLIGNRIRAFD